MARTVKQLRESCNQVQYRSAGKSRPTSEKVKHGSKKKHIANTNSYKQYSRKGLKLNKWNETNMQQAIAEYRQKEMEGTACLREISRSWRVPKSTLARRLKIPDLGHEYASGRPTVFSKKSEDELADLILDLARRGFPLSEAQVRNLATQFANANNLQVFSQNKNNEAGYYWFKGFLRRHPELCVKRAEGLSAARSGAMNKTNIEKWFSEYKELVEKLNISDSPSHIWNLDESGLQDVFQAKRAVGQKGVPLYQVTAAEKGDTTTVLPIFNAMGEIGALMVIFKGKRIRPEWAVGSPPATLIRASPDGWINKDLFLEFCKAFVKKLVNDGKKHVVLMDGHGSHVYNLEVFKLMREHNVEVLCFPPHTSHWLQPADRSIFKSLKSHWSTEGLSYTRGTGGKKCGKSDFFQIFTPAWTRCSTVENIQSGFRSSGIFPVNFNAIPDIAYLPSLTSERPMPEEPMPEQNNSISDVAMNDSLLQPVVEQSPAISNESFQLLDISANCYRYTSFGDNQPEEVDHVESFLALLTSCDNLQVSVFSNFIPLSIRHHLHSFNRLMQH